MKPTDGVSVATLILRTDRLNAYRRLAGLETDVSLARSIGVDPTTVYRVLNGRTAMSARFIAGIVATFGPDLFADLFEVVSDDDPAIDRSVATRPRRPAIAVGKARSAEQQGIRSAATTAAR